METRLNSSFDRLVGGYLEHLASVLERAGLDVDFFDLTLSFNVPDENMPYLMKVHRVREEIWVSSPVSGGKRFVFVPSEGVWQDVQNHQKLESLLHQELKQYPLDFSL